MRLTNKNQASFYNFVFTCINLLLAIGIVVSLFDILNFERSIFVRIALIAVPATLLLLFLLLGKQIFEYDSDGEVLNFRNRSIVPFLQKGKSDEFPKYKLKKYEIAGFFVYRKIFIYIYSKKDKVITLKYDISFLTRQQVKDLKISLSKVMKINRENVLVLDEARE